MTLHSDLMTYAESDIDADAARSAFNWTSMEPEVRGRQVVQQYMQAMIALEAEFERWVTDDNREAMRRDLEAYRQGYLQRLREWLAAHAKCASWMVTGRSNFPVARAERANEREHKLSVAWHEWSNETLERLRRQYDPKRLAHAPISSSDPDAPEKLRERIARATAKQELMKAANRIVRSSKPEEEKVAALVALGMKDTTARLLLHPAESYIHPGFEDWELSNNRAEIKRLQARLVEIEQQRAEDESHAENGDARVFVFSGGKVYDDPEINRYRIKYEDKPSEQVRAGLKARGFVCTHDHFWQRQRTANAKYAVRELTGVEL
jgi:hypothetical protein